MVRVAGEAAMAETGPIRRPRGRPARVDRNRIVAVARTFNPSTLTMQALAEELSVDRKTLHYWVESRSSLLRMVAADVYRDAVGAAGAVSSQPDWREVLRSFAVITRAAIASAGAWATYVSFETEEDLVAVRPAEAAVRALVEAGMSDMDAGDVVRLLSGVAFTSARNPAPGNIPGGLPQNSSKRQPQEGQYALLLQLLGRRGGLRTIDEQFDFDVQLIISGVVSLIATPRE